ncbi:MAG: ATP-binding protein [Desulfurivibrionaceae bacterium]|nr:ATP-binding protein [Desulfobulbales bacterium]MDT8335915.1 ATP-binding protein [Desulfurivibrionaceae bacterium]
MSSPFQSAFFGDIPEIPTPTLKNQLQWYLFLRVLILTVLLGIGVILQTQAHDLSIPSISYTVYFIAGIYLFTIISALLLRVVKNHKGFALLQTVVDALLVGVIVYATGCSQSIFTTLFFLPILAGSFLLLRLGGLLIASVATMSYGFILMVELLYNPLPFINMKSSLDGVVVAMHYFAIHGLIFFILGILSFIMFERMRSTESALSRTTLNYDRLQILYQRIFEDITTGIITVDDAGNITSFNHAAGRISGYKDYEVIGKMFYELFPGFRNADHYMFRQTTELMRNDGTTIPIGFSWAKLNMPGEYGDCRVYTMQDLSKIKEMENQVKQAEKMATIGEMAAGIAHEFRNPLAAISGAAQILQAEQTGDPASRRLIDIVSRESDRLDHTVSEFLLFSKPTAPVKEWFSGKAAIDETILILDQGRQIDTEICRIDNRIAADLGIWADPHQFKRIIMNLITNSCQAFGGKGGVIVIKAAEQQNKTTGKDEVIVMISDNGPGIDERVLPNIFEPFYTTRESGTGLGLAIVSQLVESHAGRTTVETVAGEKTEFSITFPLP